VTDVLIRCRDVTVGYETPVLSEINLDVRRGEIVALLGGSGSGKSTLLRALIGLHAPLAGRIELFGEDLYALDDEARRILLRQTGMAFQEDALFGALTIAGNLALPLRELTALPQPVIDEMVHMRLAAVGLAGLEHRLPAELSGGQSKRAALARATILDPQLVFCDEPSAGLDPVAAAEIDATLLGLRDVLGVTLVIVTHELDSVRALADRAIMFGRGRTIAAGTLSELERSTDHDVFDYFHARSA
jgi:phospholipid/cholesterol/gamma-HCH transport system ATP-binding protein